MEDEVAPRMRLRMIDSVWGRAQDESIELTVIFSSPLLVSLDQT